MSTSHQNAAERLQTNKPNNATEDQVRWTSHVDLAEVCAVRLKLTSCFADRACFRGVHRQVLGCDHLQACGVFDRGSAVGDLSLQPKIAAMDPARMPSA